MATKIHGEWSTISATGPGDLFQKLEELAERNGRSVSHELCHALERHLKSPPTLLTPEMVPEGAGEATPRRKPGRPKKGEVAG